MENKKQESAVEWFALELYEKFEMKGNGNLFDEILEQAKEMENYNAKIQARKYYLKGFEDAELTENQGCSHEQTMRDAETHFELVFDYQIKLK